MNEQSTTFLEQRLGEALDVMAARNVPTALTVADLVESGRRQVRRRRVRAAAGTSTALVTALAVAVGVVAGARHGGETTQSASGAPTRSVVAQFGQMDAGRGPAAPTVAFGWLPTDFSGEYEVSASGSGAGSVPATGSGSGLVPVTGPDTVRSMDANSGFLSLIGPGSSEVQVWGSHGQLLDAAVQSPGTGANPGLSPVTAAIVQGHPAYWGTGAPGSAQAARSGTLELMWQYQVQAWAFVSLSNAATSTANGQMLLAVAQSLQIGSAGPAALPFQLPAMPAGLHSDMVDIDLPSQHGAHVGYAALRLCAVSPCATTGGGVVISQTSTAWLSNSALAVDDAPELSRGGTLPAGGVVVTVGGHTAVLWTNARGATLSYTYGAAQVIIQAADKEYQTLGGRDGFLAFCQSLTWFGADPAHWTTHVLG